MKLTRPAAEALGCTFVILVMSAAVIWLDRPPAVVPASAPPTSFSAERAMQVLAQVAQSPHPTGSNQQARVGRDLVATLERMGVRVERQAAIARQLRGPGVVRAARVENLMVRLPGSASTGVVLLATHYDSVPAAPGAADAGSGVAALVETLRALRAGPPLRNDVVFLFTDGEELGLLGATVFAEEHPWAKEVRLALNFEARGTTGAVQMFETGPANGLVVGEWASLAPSPTGSSLTYEVYKRMPNDTDFSVFRRRGIAGLNFAFVGGWGHYHTPLDSLSTLDRDSLQHHGGTALALARRFGEIDLTRVLGRDRVYFSIPGSGVVIRYPEAFALVLAVVIVVLFLEALVRARRKRAVHLGAVLLAAVVHILLTAGAAFVGYRLDDATGWLHRRWLPPGDAMLSAAYASAVVAFVVACWVSAYALMRRKIAALTLALGISAVLMILCAVVSWVLPGASYVIAWPALALVLSARLMLAWQGRGAVLRVGGTALVLLLAFPVIAILAPLVVMLFVTMGLAPASAAAMTALTVLGLGALAPQVELITEGRRFWPAGVALLASVALFVTGMATTRYTSEAPRKINLAYVLDADTQSAHWTARADHVDSWLAQYLGKAPAMGRPAAYVPEWSSPTGVPGFYHAPAPAVDLPGPSAELTSQTASAEGRVLTWRIRPSAEGHALTVWASGARIVDARVEGRAPKPLPGGGSSASQVWSMDFVNAPAEGILLTLDCHGLGPINLAVLDRSAGLPEAAGRFTARPPEVVPEALGDQTVVRRSYRF